MENKPNFLRLVSSVSYRDKPGHLGLEQMLPSRAKEVLTQAIFNRMVKFTSDGKQRYRNFEAHEDFGDQVWDGRVLVECFEAAERQFDRNHPMLWSNEKQIAYRDGIDNPTE